MIFTIYDIKNPLCDSTTTRFFSQNPQKPYDKSKINSHPIFFTKFYDKKSYKMDIYNSHTRVYNEVPMKFEPAFEL